jgi:hypothetical protein
MRAHQPTPIARTLAEAELLGYEHTDARPGAEYLGVHLTVSSDTSEVVCWVGLCGDPEPGYQQVKYTDKNGLCNIYKKRKC